MPKVSISTSVKVAPPDKASTILHQLGYPIGAKTLRNWQKQRKIVGCWTGKRMLLNIDNIIQYLQSGDTVDTSCGSGGVRRITE